MTKKKKLMNNNKKKIKVNRQSSPPLSTNSSAEGVTAAALQDLCCKIDDLAFSGPGNSLNIDDYHAWCVDRQGLVHDYAPEILMLDVEYGTTDIVRISFTGDVLSERVVHCEKTYDAYLQGMKAQFGGHIEDAKKALLSIIHTPFFPPKNCYIRAKILYESDPENYSLVIGSLGFRQADGRIHWEYG